MGCVQPRHSFLKRCSCPCFLHNNLDFYLLLKNIRFNNLVMHCHKETDVKSHCSCKQGLSVLIQNFPRSGMSSVLPRCAKMWLLSAWRSTRTPTWFPPADICCVGLPQRDLVLIKKKKLGKHRCFLVPYNSHTVGFAHLVSCLALLNCLWLYSILIHL